MKFEIGKLYKTLNSATQQFEVATLISLAGSCKMFLVNNEKYAVYKDQHDKDVLHKVIVSLDEMEEMINFAKTCDVNEANCSKIVNYIKCNSDCFSIMHIYSQIQKRRALLNSIHFEVNDIIVRVATSKRPTYTLIEEII